MEYEPLKTWSWIATLSTGALSLYYVAQKYTSSPLPPGPPSYHIIGQLLSMPSNHEQFVFHNISQAVKSDIISLSFLGTTIVVLHSAEAAAELFEKKATIYSNRFAPPMIVSPAGLDLHGMMTLMNPNELWRKHRKVMHAWLSKQAVVNFNESQELQARSLLQRLLALSGKLGFSENLALHFTKCNGCPEPNGSELRGWREHKEQTFNGIYKWTKQRVADGIDDYSIIASTLQETKSWGWDEETVDDFAKHLGMVLYMGGTDTSVSALVTFMLAMVRFPNIQEKAQQEIDVVTGGDRLPTLKDRPMMPYMERLISEVLRWQPVSPLGVPHVAAKDDIYRGYRIPKGTIVAMSQDERVYPNPEVFDPDRYLDNKVPVLPGFGWGSRLCPGINLADSALFIMISSILAAFNISGSINPDGTRVIPSTEPNSNGLVYYPKPFECALCPRSELHAELIRNGL
ncbi:cytochrome P450 family protein [Rhizoctonia solani AG-3 Rhs1AP]|uniref:Cytochrome P450 family protein n=2 Tax=Rhizoctonia solani AG-3 TaxID=1086053 RepID=A0A074S834_9AGAM|nr:cytochrome P450 family protein [Rhizoctonia solani AG-3 Rhs1AP]KEP46192.1 cytochrome P450 family protein [Rhizoctonia solani 123E]